MPNMLNVVIMEGHLGADAEHKSVGNGRSLTKFRVANTRSWKDRAGERQEETTWVTVTSWNDSVKGIVPYLTKGRSVKVVGRLHSNTYEDQTGTKRTSYEVLADDILLGSDPNGERNQTAPAKQQTLKSKVQQRKADPVEEDDAWAGGDETDGNLPW